MFAAETGPFDHAPQLGGQQRKGPNGREPELSGLRASAPLIVHVDDDDGILKLIHLLLSEFGGYRVQSYLNARDALNFCRASHPALFITDISRPDIDGLTLCHMIRTDPHLRDLSIIIFSAYTSPVVSMQAHILDAELIGKPCDPFELLDTIDGKIRAQGMKAPLRQNIG